MHGVYTELDADNSYEGNDPEKKISLELWSTRETGVSFMGCGLLYLKVAHLRLQRDGAVFTARAYARAVLGVVILSVRLSVCHTRAL